MTKWTTFFRDILSRAAVTWQNFSSLAQIGEAGTRPLLLRTRRPVHLSKMAAASGEPCGQLVEVVEGTAAALL